MSVYSTEIDIDSSDSYEMKTSPDTYMRVNRSCTDKLCLLLFILYTISLIGMFVYAIYYAQVADGTKGVTFERAFRGSDYEGNICGGKGPRKSDTFNFLPVIRLDNFDLKTFIEVFRFRGCVSSCKKTWEVTQDSVPGRNSPLLVKQRPEDEHKGYPTILVANRLCLPDMKTLIKYNNLNNKYLYNLMIFSSRILISIFDIIVEDPIILLKISGVTVFFVIAYILLIIFLTSFIVWTTIFLVFSVLLGGGLFFVLTNAETYINIRIGFVENIWFSIGVILCIISFIYFIVFLCLLKSIKTAVLIQKETGKAILQMASLFIIPFFMLVITLLFIILWCVAFSYIYSIRSVKKPGIVPDLIYDAKILPSKTYPSYRPGLLGYICIASYIFGIVWYIEICKYFTFLVLSGSFSNWYFTPFSNHKKKRFNRNSVFKSLSRSFFYHLGTVCFASIILTLIFFVRQLIKIFMQCMKLRDNKLTACIKSCVNCLLWFFQKIVEELSEASLVMTAINGDNFCRGGKHAASLILANKTKTVVTGFIENIVVFLGKILVIAASVASLMLYVESISYSFIALSVLVSFIITYFMLELISVGSTTILMCFLYDKKVHRKEGMFAPKGLLRLA